MISARRLVHSVSVPIRWGDMDAQGHLNNTVYFQYMEQARIEWLESVRERVGDVNGLGSVIVNASCTFLLPLCYPGTVDADVPVRRVGRALIATTNCGWTIASTLRAAPASSGSISVRTPDSAAGSGCARFARSGPGFRTSHITTSDAERSERRRWKMSGAMMLLDAQRSPLLAVDLQKRCFQPSPITGVLRNCEWLIRARKRSAFPWWRSSNIPRGSVRWCRR